MSRRHLIALAVSLLTSIELFAGFSKTQDFRPATPEELSMKSSATTPGASAAILEWVRIDDDTLSTSSEYYRIKIFNADGKKYGDVEIPYSPAYPANMRVQEISARTIRPDGSIVPFDGKVFDKVLYKSGRSALLRSKTFSLADVQPGSILEYRFVRRWSETTLLDTNWTLQRDIPIEHAKMTLKPYDSQGEFSSFFTYVNLPQGKLPVRTGDKYDLAVEHMPPFQHEPFAPPEETLTAHVDFYYTTSRIKPEAFWPAEAASWSKKVEGFLGGKSDAVRTMAQQAAAGSKDANETLRKIYAKVQSLRNYTFESFKSDAELKKQDISEARNVNDVLSHNGGYQDEINRAFVAVARAAGLQANVMRVAPRDEGFFSDKLPDARQMSGEIAVVTIDGKPLYLDPGTPHAPFGIVSWEKTNVPGFEITKGAPAKWSAVPSPFPGDAMTKRTAVLRLTAEDALEGTVTVTFSGQEALTRRLRSISDDDAARTKAFEDEVRGWFAAGAKVKATKVSGFASFDEPLTGTFDVVLPIVSRAGSRVVMPISVFAANATNPFAATTRTNPIYFDYSRAEEDDVKVTVPEGLQLPALPRPVQIDAGAFTYRNEITRQKGELAFHRVMSLDAALMEQKFYSAVRNFFNAVATADQKPLVFTPAAQ